MTVAAEGLTIDEFANGEELSALGTRWRVRSLGILAIGRTDGHGGYLHRRNPFLLTSE